MLLRKTSDSTVAVSQPAHALLTGLLARCWGGEAFAVPRPGEQAFAASSPHEPGDARRLCYALDAARG